MNKLVESYLEELAVNEQLYSITTKVQANKSSIISALKSQNPEKVKAALSVLPHVSLDKLSTLAFEHIEGFSIEYSKAIKKVDGTPEERRIKALAISIVYALKKHSKIPQIINALKDFKTDPSYAFVIRDIFSALCLLGVAYLAYIGIGAILTFVGYGLAYILVFTLVIALILASLFLSGELNIPAFGAPI
jgi:hypothetical protein